MEPKSSDCRGLAVATIIGQAIAVLVRLKTITERLEKQMHKQGETFFHALERLEDRLDKRLSDMQAETNHRFTETNHRFTEMNQRLSDMQSEIRDVRSEISNVRSEMSKLNQNHIEHLTHHE